MFTQAAFKHVASICKRTSFQVKEQFLFRAHTPLQRRRAVRRSKSSRCSLITHRLARETPRARQERGCVRTPSKQARNGFLLLCSPRCRLYLGLNEGVLTKFRCNIPICYLGGIKKKKGKYMLSLFMVLDKRTKLKKKSRCFSITEY